MHLIPGISGSTPISLLFDYVKLEKVEVFLEWNISEAELVS